MLGAFVRLLVMLLRRGCRPGAVVNFLQTRHLQSQLLLGKQELVFLTSMPYTFGQNPWVIEIEDPTTLFYPHVQNGHTCGMSLAESPYFPIVKALLEADHCKAILTHMRSTAELVPVLFQSEAIRRKVIYAPLGVRLPDRWQRHEPQAADEPIHLLFINSWCQVPENFYVRGGLDVLEAFAILHKRYPQLRLTMRTALPTFSEHYLRILEGGWVRVINRFMSDEEMAALHAESHVFLLPARGSTSSRCSRRCPTGWRWSAPTGGGWRSTSRTSGTGWWFAGGTARRRGPTRRPGCCARTTR